MKKSTEKLTKKDILEDVTKDDPEQSRRFVETAVSVETDESMKLFGEAIKSIKPKAGRPDPSG